MDREEVARKPPAKRMVALTEYLGGFLPARYGVIENRLEEDLPLVTERMLTLDEPESVREFRLGGYRQPGLQVATKGTNKYLGGNPTLFLDRNQSGLGFFIVDDVLRVHFRVEGKSNTLKVIDPWPTLIWWAM